MEWGDGGDASYSVDVLVRGYDRKGLHKDVANVIAQQGAHVLAINSRVDPARGMAEFALHAEGEGFRASSGSCSAGSRPCPGSTTRGGLGERARRGTRAPAVPGISQQGRCYPCRMQLRIRGT